MSGPTTIENRAAHWSPEEWADWLAEHDAGRPGRLHFAPRCDGEHTFWAPNPDGHTCPPILCGTDDDFTWLTSSREVFDEYAEHARRILGQGVEFVCRVCAEWVHA